jgi:hypothetical protein
MSQSANVTSIEAIKEFRSSLCRFGEDVQNALGAVEMEIRRALDWVLHEQPAYWQMQIKRRKEDLAEAQAEAFKRRLQAGQGREVHDSEQREAVRTAQRRMMEAEEKLQRVKKWGPVFQHAVSEYQARARPTGDMLGSDLRVAIELLDRMTNALDAYVAMAPPSFSNQEVATTSSATESMTEPVRTASMAVPLRTDEPEPNAASAPTVEGERSEDQGQTNPVPDA